MSFDGVKGVANGVYGIESNGFADPAHLGPGTNTSTTLGYLANVTSDIQTQFGSKAPLVSPSFTGTPTAPTQSALDNSTKLATTAYTDNAVSTAIPNPLPANRGGTGLNFYSPGDLIVATANTVLSTISSTAVGKIFVSMGLGVAPGFTNNPSAGTMTLYNTSNQLIFGVTNTLTFTMAALTASRTCTFPDANSNTVQPTTSTAGQAVGYIDNNGLQNMIVITSQLLTSLVTGVGGITSSDTILSALGKLAGSNPANYTTVTTATSVSLTTYQRMVVVTATGQTITLPSQIGLGTLPGTIFLVIFPASASTPGTIAVQSGDSLNGVVNGTFAVPGVLTNNSPCRIAPTAAGWWTC